MVGFQVELSALESLCYFCKLMWPETADARPKLPILDTLIYHQGKPHWWVFTSQKTGEIMKKKPSRLLSVMHVVNAFKKVFHTFSGRKPPDLKTKVALVWYAGTSSSPSLASYLVDEMELTSLLSSTAAEVLAIQAYIGGYAVKGNGVFEHRINKLTKTGTVKYQTLESCDPDALDQHSVQFTLQHTKQLVITEHQHELLRSLATMLTRHIESVSRAKVSQLAFTAVFNSTWTPFLVAIKALTLTEAPEIFAADREAAVYPMGAAPAVPALPQRSLLLPMGTAEVVHAQTGSGTPAHGSNRKERRRPRSAYSAIRSSQAFALEQLLAAPSPRITAPDPPPPDEVQQQNDAEEKGEVTEKVLPRTELTIITATANATKTRPRSAPPTSQNPNPNPSPLMTRNPKSPATTTTASVRPVSPHLLMATETVSNRLARTAAVRDREADDSSPKELKAFFPVRRPISAPHAAVRAKMRRHAVNALQSSGSEFIEEVDASGLSNQHLHHPLPLAGHQCFGDYCMFIQQVDQQLKEQQALPAAKSAMCPHRLAQKSVLLARAEVKFTGQLLDEKVHSWVLRLKLSQMDSSQLYAYFVRRHLNLVAQRCQEEARKLSMNGARTPLDMWEDLNVIYRRLVYADALGAVHASRFYYTVPVCESCYKVYAFMDEQRDALILFNPEQSNALHKSRSTTSKSNLEGMAGDSQDIFHRLCYGNDSSKHDQRPRAASAITLGSSSSKLRVMQAIQQNHEKQAAKEVKSRDKDKDRLKAVDLSSPRPAPMNIIQENILLATAQSNQRPVANAIFSQIPDSKSKRPSSAPATRAAAEPSKKSADSRLADLYGYASLPFEHAPQLPSNRAAAVVSRSQPMTAVPVPSSSDQMPAIPEEGSEVLFHHLQHLHLQQMDGIMDYSLSLSPVH